MELVNIPPNTRNSDKIIERRLPKIARVKDKTGLKIGIYKVIGYAGIYENDKSCWLIKCNECHLYFISKDSSIEKKKITGSVCGHRIYKNKHAFEVWKKVRSNILTYEPWRESYQEFEEYVLSLREGMSNKNGSSLYLKDARIGCVPDNIIWMGHTGKLLTHNNKCQTISAWAKELGYNPKSMCRRYKQLKKGKMSQEDFFKPKIKK